MSNFPIWVAETQRVSTLALPDEAPADVLDLVSEFPRTRYLILTSPEGDHWPTDLAAARPGAECFVPVELGPHAGAGPGHQARLRRDFIASAAACASRASRSAPSSASPAGVTSRRDVSGAR